MLPTQQHFIDKSAQIMAAIKSAGYVKLADDQSLPNRLEYVSEISFAALTGYTGEKLDDAKSKLKDALKYRNKGYSEAQQDMVTPKDGYVWMKVFVGEKK